MKNEAITLPRLALPGEYEQTFKDGETVLLTVRAAWPRLEEDSPGCRRIDRYYEALAQRWQDRWKGPLLDRAKEVAGPETEPWEASMSFTVTLLTQGLFSLYIDITERTGERRPRRVRLGDVWQLPSGTPVGLREVLPPRRWWKGPIYEAVRREVGRQVEGGEAVYWEDWPTLVSRRFSPSRWYLTEEGPVVFYPVESIAPAMEGFPTFSLRGLTEGANP